MHSPYPFASCNTNHIDAPNVFLQLVLCRTRTTFRVVITPRLPAPTRERAVPASDAMRDSRGDGALASSPSAAKRHRTITNAASSPSAPDDFSHCLLYNVSLTDMLVSTQHVAAEIRVARDLSIEEAREKMCSSLGRPKFSNQVRRTRCVCNASPRDPSRHPIFTRCLRSVSAPPI